MVNSLPIKSTGQYLPNIQGSFSNISEPDPITKKVIKVVGLIISLPWLIIKDSAFHLKRCFVKESSEFNSEEDLIVKHNSTARGSSMILKVALVGVACLGLIKLQGLTPPKDPSLLDKIADSNVAKAAITLASLGAGKFIFNKIHEFQDPFKKVSSLDDLESEYSNIKNSLSSSGAKAKALDDIELRYTYKKFKLKMKDLDISSAEDLDRLNEIYRGFNYLDNFVKKTISVSEESTSKAESLSNRMQMELSYARSEWQKKRELIIAKESVEND